MDARVFRTIFRATIFFAAVCTGVGCGGKTPLEHYDAAQQQIESQQIRAAIIELKNAIQKDTQFAAARSLLGELHMQVGDFPAALKELDRAIDLGDDGESTQVALLSTKTALGYFNEVIGELEEATSLSPPFAVVLGNAYLAAGDVTRATPLLNQGKDLHDGKLGLARVALANNDLLQAEKIVADLVQEFPESRTGWLTLGEIQLQMQDAEHAEQSFATAKEMPGGGVSGLTGQVRALLVLEDLEQAHQLVEKLVEMVPNYPPANYLAGLVYFRQGRYDEAENALRAVQNSAPDHVPTMLLMGTVQAQSGNLNQAVESVRRYLSRDADNWSARKLLASILQRLNEPEQVIETILEASKDTVDYQGWAMLGNAYMRNGENSLAVQALEAAVELSPDDASVRNQLALQLIVAGDDDRARTQIETAMETDGGQFESDYLLVMLMLKEGEFEQANKAVDTMIAKSADHPVGYSLRGRVALAQDNRQAAIEGFETALRLEPTYFPAARQLAMLAESDGNSAKAVQILKSVDEHGEGNGAVIASLIDTLARSGDLPGALSVAEDGISRFPGTVPLHVARVRLLVATGRHAQAAEAAEDGLSNVPNSPDLMLLKGGLAVQLGDSQAAQSASRWLQRWVQSNKTSALMYGQLGALQARIGQLDLAESNLDKALEVDAGLVSAMLGMARLALAKDDSSSATQWLDRAMKSGAEGEQVQLLAAAIFDAQGKTDESLSIYADLAEGNSRSGILGYASLAIRENRLGEAGPVLDSWIEENPKDEQALVLRAEAELLRGERQNALRTYESALPSNDAALLNNLAWLYMEFSDDRAEEVARRAYEVSSNNPDIADTLGWILVQNDALSEGLSLLKEASRARPNNASVLYHVAVGHFRSGVKSSAKTALTRAIDLGAFAEREAAIKLLKEIESR